DSHLLILPSVSTRIELVVSGGIVFFHFGSACPGRQASPARRVAKYVALARRATWYELQTLGAVATLAKSKCVGRHLKAPHHGTFFASPLLEMSATAVALPFEMTPWQHTV
ncbi:unnamed protein product, partial [Ectocarpus sp. 8 AP-2014]